MKNQKRIEIIKQVNELGQKFSNEFEQFQFISFSSKESYGHVFIKVKNLKTNKTKEVRFSDLKRGRTPFNLGKNLSPEFIEAKTNELGLKGKKKEQYFFVSLLAKKHDQNAVRIKNLTTGEIKDCQFNNLYAYNPFNLSGADRDEVKNTQPKIKKLLEKNKLTVEQEVRISKRSRIDLVCTNRKGQKILVEVKSDKKNHTKENLTTQISKYKIDGRRKFGKKYAGTFLVSLTGRYGYSVKELTICLKQKGLI